MSQFFFIQEEKWLKFAQEIGHNNVICKNGVAMYDSLCFKRRTNAAALSVLTMHMCLLVGAGEVWREFVKDGLLAYQTHRCHELNESHDTPSNDWKPNP